ncbi:MAG: transketolase [Patescibacteria group bacterium]|nr:transketolase [Patescibacteria group bacterium]
MRGFTEKAKLVRRLCLTSTASAGSGHPTSCLSSADLMTVLFDKYFTYDIKNIENPNNDRIIFSKGHAAPLLYSLFALSGAFPVEELNSLRKFNSNLEGHPTPRFPYAEVATGSLGQGLSIACGQAIGTSNLPKIYVLLGDGEMAEGQVWEAANFASYYKLNNLIAIIDVNRLGQSQETMFSDFIEEYIDRFRSFGWEAIGIDGHNLLEIERAFNVAIDNPNKPFAIIARTKKGKGVSFLEDKEGWHGKALNKEELQKALLELGNVDENLRFDLKVPSAEVAPKNFFVPQLSRDGSLPDYNIFVARQDANEKNFVGSPRLSHQINDQIATREVYGKVLAKLADKNPLIFALDGDVKNSTFSEDFKKVHPERFIECFIAEQNMVGVATGLSARGKIPFVSTFASFFTRAFDQIRMAAISKSNIKFMGSHAGVSIGQDGPSQMGLEDISMFGVIPGSVIFHPSDAISCSKLILQMLIHNGIFYLRTLRSKTPVIYKEDEKFTAGGSKILRESKEDVLTVASCGTTVHEALKAYEELKKEGVLIRVIDCYSVKPIDSKTLNESLNETKKKIIITTEDHYEHGGLGDFILSAVSKTGATVEKLAVREIPRSGTQEELLDFTGINALHIVDKIKKLL